MYESTFSDDWDDLTRDEAVERAYALGVAAACGHDNRTEYKEIKASADSAYDRSLVELSFDQGKSQALNLESSGSESEDIWAQLVESSTIELPSSDAELPESLGPAELLDRFDHLDGPPETLAKPSFLLRDKEDNE